MAKTKLIFFLIAALSLVACRPEMRWEKIPVDGHRTGVLPVTTTLWQPSLGTVDSVYHAPNGTDFGPGTVMESAKILISAQERMSGLKEAIGYCPKRMKHYRPESELSNWAVDAALSAAPELFGRKADIGIMNFGGIRIEMPEGNVTVDDIHSMFPFRNYFSYVKLKGSDVRYIFDFMARRRRPEVIGGARFTIKDGKAEDITVGGKPLDDGKLYGIITLDFLLDGGDSLYVARNARELIIDRQKLGDWYEGYLRKLNAGGEPITAEKDGRVVIL